MRGLSASGLEILPDGPDLPMMSYAECASGRARVALSHGAAYWHVYCDIPEIPVFGLRMRSARV